MNTTQESNSILGADLTPRGAGEILAEAVAAFKRDFYNTQVSGVTFNAPDEGGWPVVRIVADAEHNLVENTGLGGDMPAFLYGFYTDSYKDSRYEYGIHARAKKWADSHDVGFDWDSPGIIHMFAHPEALRRLVDE